MDNIRRPTDTFMVFPGMKPAYTTDPKHPGEKRLPGCNWLPNRVRNILISMIGEFVGTYLFLFFAFAATQVANTRPAQDSAPNVGVLLYIALAFGFSLAVNVWIFFRISGGLFNPAVSIALALVGAIGWVKAGLLIFTQVVAAIAAAAVVSALLPGDLAVRTSLNPNTSVVRGLFIEMLLTAELIFCIFMLAAEKHKATFLAPIGIGLALFIAELAGVYFTGGSLNPARSLGPDVVLWTFDGYHWIYWLGPILGAIVAVLFYRLIKGLEYETANPGADSDGRDAPGRYVDTPESVVPVVDNRGASRRVDGTDETEFVTPFHPIDRPLSQRHGEARSSAPPSNVTFNSAPSLQPDRPLPVYHHGGDGHRSQQSFIDHPNDRPRAQHSQIHDRPRASHSQIPQSQSSRSRYSEPDSEFSYRSAPSIESASSPSRSSGSTASSSVVH